MDIKENMIASMEAKRPKPALTWSCASMIIIVTTRIAMHPNIHTKGEICCSLVAKSLRIADSSFYLAACLSKKAVRLPRLARTASALVATLVQLYLMAYQRIL